MSQASTGLENLHITAFTSGEADDLTCGEADDLTRGEAITGYCVLMPAVRVPSRLGMST
jgi:hypothetical protein